VPFQSTTEPFTKLVPFTAIVNAVPPAMAVEGASEEGAGTGLLIVTVVAAVAPPPGAAFTTVTGYVPATAKSAAGTIAVIWVELTNVVTRGTPFHTTTDPATKFVPARFMVNAEAPATAVVGETEPRVGSGLLTVKF
jgi:hypothetical protein